MHPRFKVLAPLPLLRPPSASSLLDLRPHLAQRLSSMSSSLLIAPVAPSRYRQLVTRGLLALLALVCVLHFTSSKPPSAPPSIAKSHPGNTLTFKSYLKAHFPLSAPLSDDLGEELARPHLWLTVADAQMADGPAAGLQMMVRKLNQEREARIERTTELVILCLDSGCLSKAEERGWFAYGGFRGGVPIRMVGGPKEWFKVAGESRCWSCRRRS